MISIVDERYHNRAWCAVETMIVRSLQESSVSHRRYEHILHEADSEEPYGRIERDRLGQSSIKRPSELKITDESDRRYIEFLERQSMLLGKAASEF